MAAVRCEVWRMENVVCECKQVFLTMNNFKIGFLMFFDSEKQNNENK